jgi:uncharacterized protein with HEPN domain
MRHESLYLKDIVEACQKIEEFLQDQTKESFCANNLIRAAVLQKLMIVGEAITHVSRELISRHPEVEWRAIRAFRNFAVHSYFAVRWDIIWDTTQEDAPLLRKQIGDLLRAEYPGA